MPLLLLKVIGVIVQLYHLIADSYLYLDLGCWCCTLPILLYVEPIGIIDCHGFWNNGNRAFHFHHLILHISIIEPALDIEKDVTNNELVCMRLRSDPKYELVSNKYSNIKF